MDARKAVNFEAVGVSLMVFGGTNKVTRISGCEDAFAKAFSVQRNKRSWEMVGATPPAVTRLESNEAQANETDANFSTCETVEASNHIATSMLTAKGFNGELTRVVSN